MFFKRKKEDISVKKIYGIEDLLDFMKTADAGGYWGMNDNINITANDINVEIKGTRIEPVWEFFEGACIVKVNNEVLYGEGSKNTAPYQNEKYIYGKYGSREETAQGLMELLKDKDCVINTEKEKIQCVFIPDKQVEKNINDNIESDFEEDDMEM